MRADGESGFWLTRANAIEQKHLLFAGAILLLGGMAGMADERRGPDLTPFEPLRPLVGSWKGTATPLDPESKRRRAFWRETAHWRWHFAKNPMAGEPALAGLQWVVDDGRRFRGGMLTHDARRNLFVLEVELRDGSRERYEGRHESGRLELIQVNAAPTAASASNTTVTRTASPLGRVAIRVVGENRYTESWWEAKGAGVGESGSWRPIIDIGHTRQGIQFAAKSAGPVCIVTGGHGTITVRHGAKAYYVCCEGCRQAFQESPESFIGR